MSKLYPTDNIKFEKVREVWIFNDFLKFIYQIPIEFRIRNMQNFLQTDMIFFNQFKVPMVKFRKYFAEFIIPIALLEKFGS